MGNDWKVLLIKLTLSDIIFKQHQTGEHGLNMVVIITQVVALIVGTVVSSTTPFNLLPMCASLNIILAVIVMLNNYIHSKAWETAKKSLDEISVALEDMGKRLDEFELEKLNSKEDE